MESRLLPVLGADGWVDSAISKADFLFTHIFLSNYSQTYLYLGNVASLAYEIQKGNGDINATISYLTNRLTSYFSGYFTNVIVEITEVPDVTDSSVVKLSIFLSFNDNGQTFSLGKILQMVDRKASKIIDINNGKEVNL